MRKDPSATSMEGFLRAQSAAPHDPVPMLVWADHLEERGDATAAEVLRGLAGAGIASLVWLSSAGGPAASLPYKPDLFWAREGQGFGDRIAAEGDDRDDPPSGDGAGDGDGFGTGKRDALGLEGWHAYGGGDGDAGGHGHGSGYGSSDESGWGTGQGSGGADA